MADMKVVKLIVKYHEEMPFSSEPEIEKNWFLDKRVHRSDGPAYSLSSGIREFWKKGKRIRVEFVEC